MFDPFGDFETAGYLRNTRKDKDEAKIKHFEHDLFKANLGDALAYLESRKILTYQDFLEVHRILFSDYYPWAGKDRLITMPDRAVIKGDVIFCHPQDSRRAIESGLRIGQNKAVMTRKPGEVMGLFAYGHPFLDGNGRAMLLVHLELTHRAGYSISWRDTNKIEYLDNLSREIEKPGRGILDAYLLKFKCPRLERSDWGKSLLSMKGLDGLDSGNQIEGDIADIGVQERYRQFEKQRSYTYQALSTSSVCTACGATPCVCNKSGMGCS